MNSKVWPLALGVTLMGAILMVALDVVLNASFWEGMWVPEGTFTYFCETTLVDHFIRQPGNTYTNLGYLLGGAVMMRYGWLDQKSAKRNLVERFPIYSWIYGAMLVYTWWGSSLFHASLAFGPEWIDLSAVYAVTSLPVAYNLHRITGVIKGAQAQVPAWPFVILWLGWVVFSSVFTWEMKAHTVMPILVGSMGASVAWLEWKSNGPVPWKWIGWSSLATVTGLLFFVFDLQRIGCWPDAWLHPHGLWHLSAAGAAVAYYGYMRAERLVERH